MLSIRIGLFLLLAAIAKSGNHFWAPKWGIVLSWCVLEMGIRVSRKTHWLFGSAIAYTLFLPVLKSATIDQFNSPTALSFVGLLEFLHRWSISTTAFTVTLVTFLFLQFRKKDFECLFQVMAGLAFIDSVYVIAQVLFGNVGGGFMGEPSMNACFIGIATPFILKHFPIGFGIVPIVAAFASDSSAGILAAGIGTLSIIKHKKSALAFLATMSGIGFLIQGHRLISSYDRIIGYKMAVSWFSERNTSDWIFGVGPGAMLTITPYLGKIENAYWWQLHSDILRCVFELGTVGFLLWASVFVLAFLRSWNKPELFFSLLAAVAVCPIQYPSLLPLTVLLVTAVTWRSLSLSVGMGDSAVASET